MTEQRETVFPGTFLVGIILASILAILIFLPVWRCAHCDLATWKKAYPNLVARGGPKLWNDSPDQCELCGHSGKMNLYQRWAFLKDLEKCGLHPGYPLIP
jgi:hypothetical protein